MIKKPPKQKKQHQIFKHPTNLTISQSLELVGGINAALQTHPSYQGAFPEEATQREDLLNGEKNLRASYLAVLAGNLTLVPQRDAAKEKLDEDLYHFVHYAEMKGRRDPNALINIGLDSLVYTGTTRMVKAAPVIAPVNFTVTHTNNTKTAVAKVNSMAGVRSWVLWYTDGDPADESSWRYYKTFTVCSMEITGLEPGRLYYFRLRGVNSYGASPWTSPVSFRAI